MSTPVESDPSSSLRRSLYAILIVVGAAGLLGRIMSVDAVDSTRLESYLYNQGRDDWQRKLPFLSANDRSRWLTIRSLVEHGTYKIDDVIFEPNWFSIDVVKHDDDGRAAPGPDEGHFYSSKPPLLATLAAGEYWLIYKCTGYTLGEHPYGVGRFMLATINIPLMVVMWLLLARHVERYGRTDFGRVFVLAGAIFGTLQTTFAVSLNNHLVAAAAAMLLFDAVVRIAVEEDLRWWRFVQAGFFAAFMAANELPALSLAAIAGAGLLLKYPKPTLAFALPAALVVVVAACGTNYAAHGTIRPAYGFREKSDSSGEKSDPAPVSEKNWYVYKYRTGGKPDGAIRDSYWTPGAKRGAVDIGEPRPEVYVFHVLIGHHGIFSLTPIWLLTFVGFGVLGLRRDEPLKWVAIGITASTLVCLVFYLSREQLDRNYGGTAAGFRWVFWFAPLWCAMMLPVVDACAKSRVLRGVCLLLLAGSVVSVTFPTWNPWELPWLTQLFVFMGWSTLGG